MMMNPSFPISLQYPIIQSNKESNNMVMFITSYGVGEAVVESFLDKPNQPAC
jgi:hypothetical protein